MSNHMTYSGAILLASLLVGVAVTGSPAGAQTATAAADECLAKPNGPSPHGSHWYYRVDRASNRHCWYLRGIGASAGQNETKPSRGSAMPARPSATTADDAPTVNMPSSPPAPMSAGAFGRNAAPQAEFPVSPPAAPTAPAPDSAPQTAAGVADQPATQPPSAPTIDAPIPARDAKAAKRAAMEPPPSARPAVPVEETTHMPALVGIGLALALIVLGSFAGRLVLKYFGRPRRRPFLHPPGSDWDRPSFHVDDAPGIVPALRRRPDITQDAHDFHDEPLDQKKSQPARRHGLDAVAAIEANVRDLLVKLRSEPQGRSGAT